MKKIRTFVAVETGGAVRRAAVDLIGRLSKSPADVRWVEPENMHITLKFLGDVAMDQTPEVCQAVIRAAADVAAFELQVRGAGAFPHLGRPGTVWIGVGQGAEAIDALQRRVEKALNKLGFPREARKFHPHLTLGRARRGRDGLKELGALIRENAEFDAGSTRIGEAVVFSSQLRPEGPIYQVLGRAALADPG